ncbi:WhiB family transcriptional regulator [Amycolatopsis cynarae]|uniref:WhiB family transcriptional regulator n=1 Tax=Amycolatopsis cynarae TaxID=2995223 RepID=A0ABY7AUV9_9PSEU|nr:WhiB family transcriptional regulator [Amycolatopsis sp. HUAS 11-8]WAL63760.1 WhiB family transcriptional regulator [Amycolatopsis sp. HUAS 11-8]
MNPDDYAEIAKRLDRLAPVPDDVLAELVSRDGLCFWAFDREDMPALPDRALAAWTCAGCPVIDQCLELELRTGGADTLGVWGALAETDRQSVHRIWQWRRAKGGEQ